MGTGAEEDLEWNLHCSCVYPGFPGGSDDEGSVCNAGELGSILGGGEAPLEKGVAPTLEFLPGEFQGRRSLASYSPWGHKEPDVTE